MPLTIGEDTYTVPPLSLGQLRNGMLKKLEDHDQLLAKGNIYEAMTIRGEVILEALRRNYPTFDQELLWNHLDLKNTNPIWLAVLGASGFSSGETEAAPGTSGQSTGA